MNTPNLDSADIIELQMWEREFRALASYCDLAQQAQHLRRTGNIERAIKYEREADKVYNTLGDDVRW